MISTAVLCTLLVGTALAGPTPHHNGEPHRHPGTPFKLCVPEGAFDACEKMIKEGLAIGVNMKCIVARDRMECIEKIENHSADWGAVDPEDMYVAANYKNDLFGVFKEIRTKEEPKNEFRYEAVAVIHKDLEINDLHQLKGLRSCHTGVGRNVGYKIPITKLTKKGLLPPLNHTDISPRENELRALSSFFSKACLVGKWSPDPETNARWKSQYSNLCQLCEFPEKCDYPDQNSGYEGALRCLAKGDGQVAWTKVIFVKKFFGMPYGTQPGKEVDVNKDDYVYLCPDATKRPISGTPCTWAARPWPGYMANTEITHTSSELKELRDEIAKLNNLGESKHADWISSVLALANTTLAVDNNGPYSPKQYLDKANYTDVIERDVLKPARKVRLCVVTSSEKEKCENLRKAAYSRDIRPQFECVQKASQEECFNAIKNKEADIVSIDAGHFKEAESKNLEPVITEIFDDGKTSQHVVAIVKKASSINSFSDLKGKKACLGETGSAAGWKIPEFALKKSKAINKNDCPTQKAFSEFFSAGIQSKDTVECLAAGEGDVAFVGALELKEIIEEIEIFKPDDYELLKLQGGRCSIDKVSECDLAEAPARIIMSHKELSQVERDDITFAVLEAGEDFTKGPHIFKLFGDYNTEPNVIFSNYADGFITTHKSKEFSSSFGSFKNILSEEGLCSS